MAQRFVANGIGHFDIGGPDAAALATFYGAAAGAHGGRVVMPVTDNGWVKRAQIADPAGNVVTLIKG